MKDEKLLKKLLAAESEDEVAAVLEEQGLMPEDRWRYLGDTPNNQSIVHAQQSTAAAALAEKYTNAVDAILIRHCKAKKIDPRGADAHTQFPTMASAVEAFFGDLSAKSRDEITKLAVENIVLYATGSKDKTTLSLYDAGEGQLAKDFSTTFCSLIHGTNGGSYKGAIPFTQGRFNMGGTGVLPFCGDKYKFQLIVSRVPKNVAGTNQHEWAFTLLRYFPGHDEASWRYLVGPDKQVLTAGSAPLGLLPQAKSPQGEALPPRDRKVESGTLVKMYDFKGPKPNICGDLARHLQGLLLRPALPLRIIECRPERKANVMAVNMWDSIARWSDLFEEDFEDGASIVLTLSTGESVPAELRVFKSFKDEDKKKRNVDIVTGVRALINGQSHAKREESFFKNKSVDKEHIASSLLVTMDCTMLGQATRNAIFMSNRETFRDDPLLQELLAKLTRELREHEALKALNKKRYAEKLKNAVQDDVGISALEELLATDPVLAKLFGSTAAGKTAAPLDGNVDGTNDDDDDPPTPFKGVEFPTYFHRKDGATSAEIIVPRGGSAIVSFVTDVKNNYFTRRQRRGLIEFEVEGSGPIPTYRLFNGRLTFTCTADKVLQVGSTYKVTATISNKARPEKFEVVVSATVVEPKEKIQKPKPDKSTPPKVQTGPSRPEIKEREDGPDEPPLTVERDPGTRQLVIFLNTTSHLLDDARKLRKPEEEAAVNFVYKYGLALVAMGLLDSERQSEEWETSEGACRDRIATTAKGVARVIVPICLSLPQSLPKK